MARRKWRAFFARMVWGSGRGIGIGVGLGLGFQLLLVLNNLGGRDRQDMEQTTALIAAFCKNPTEENLVNVARFTHQKDAKTCKILTANFSQTFQRVTADSWVSKEGPDGLCGVVNISRLERVGAGSTDFWVYTTNRVVTNKSSSSSPQICKSLEEGEHFFDWKGGGDRFLGCEYIEMGFQTNQ